MSHLTLITGDPFRKDHEWKTSTFTRFALPFAYDLTPWKAAVPRLRYVPLSGSGGSRGFPDQERRAYFTPETARVLYDRSQWLRLAAPDQSQHQVGPVEFDIPVTVGGSTRRMTTMMEPPTLVLFEASDRESRPPCADQTRAELWSGFLLIDLWWPEDAGLTFDELLAINEGFRFWRSPFPGHSELTQYGRLVSEAPRSPDQFEMLKRGSPQPVAYEERWLPFLTEAPVQINGTRYRLFPNEWDQSAAPFDPAHPTGGKSWAIYADNRTFVWTAAVIPGGFHAMAPPDDPHRHGRWIRLLNIDQPAVWNPAGSTLFEQRWAEPRSYTRWLHFGTIYGFNYHAGAMLSGDCSEPPLAHHFATIYWDQVMLLLYVRFGAFRFSDALSRISSVELEENGRKLSARFRALRGSFAFFTNLYRFPLLSNQQQGIELYQKAREGLDVDQLFKEVDQEVAATHDYVEIIEQSRGNQIQTALTVVATAAIIVAFAARLLGLWGAREPALEIGAWIWSLIYDWTFWLLSAFLLVTILAWVGGPLAHWWRPRDARWLLRLRCPRRFTKHARRRAAHD